MTGPVIPSTVTLPAPGRYAKIDLLYAWVQTLLVVST